MAAEIRPSTGDARATADDTALRALCQAVWTAWNDRDAAAFAAQFEPDGCTIGFDGSTMDGREAIGEQLRQIFADHHPAAYVGKVQRVQLLEPNVASVRAIAGMVRPGAREIMPQVNAIQVFVARKRDGAWHIVSYQNTPAQFHGRPELVAEMTAELQGLV